MTLYEYLKELENHCVEVALTTPDKDIKLFYSAAARGFKKRAFNLADPTIKATDKQVKTIENRKNSKVGV